MSYLLHKTKQLFTVRLVAVKLTKIIDFYQSLGDARKHSKKLLLKVIVYIIKFCVFFIYAYMFLELYILYFVYLIVFCFY